MMLTWNVKKEDWNGRCIKDYDVLKYYINSIKRLKKQSANKAEFDEELKMKFMSQYWSRCEYELLLEKTDDGNLILKPWIGKDNFFLDATNDKDFDWNSFLKYHTSAHRDNKKVKIDIFDQLMWRWEEFVDYCWYTRLPYEKKNTKQ